EPRRRARAQRARRRAAPRDRRAQRRAPPGGRAARSGGPVVRGDRRRAGSGARHGEVETAPRAARSEGEARAVPAMTCHDAREQLSALIDEALGAEERGAVEGHLATCAECRRELERLRDPRAPGRGRAPPPRRGRGSFGWGPPRSSWPPSVPPTSPPPPPSSSGRADTS